MTLVHGGARVRMAAALPLLLASCASELEQATQVVVVVGGDPSIEQLEITVQSAESGFNQSDSRVIDLVPQGERQRRLPTSFTLVPSDPERPEAARFRLVVLGRKPGPSGMEPYVQRIAVAGFSEGQTTVLPLVLSAECSPDPCSCLGDVKCESTCLPGNVAKLAGCYPVPEYVKLASVEPGRELEAIEQGLGECAGGELPDDKRCADLDECAFGMDMCDWSPNACVNLIGTTEQGSGRPYGCRCPAGYHGPGSGPDGCQPNER